MPVAAPQTKMNAASRRVCQRRSAARTGDGAWTDRAAAGGLDAGSGASEALVSGTLVSASTGASNT